MVAHLCPYINFRLNCSTYSAVLFDLYWPIYCSKYFLFIGSKGHFCFLRHCPSFAHITQNAADDGFICSYFCVPVNKVTDIKPCFKMLSSGVCNIQLGNESNVL